MKLIDSIKAVHPLIKLLIWTVILGSVSYLVTENPFRFDDITCKYVLYDTVCFIVILLLLFSSEFISSDSDIKWKAMFFLFIPRFLAYLSTAILMIGESFKFYELNFWLCLSFWVIVFYQNSYIAAVGEVLEEISDAISKPKEEGKNAEQKQRKRVTTLEQFILALSAAWTIATIFITLGTTIFNYGNHPIHKLQEIHTLLDLRINLAIIIGVFIAFKSMVTVIQTKVINIKQPFNPKEKKAIADERNKAMSILLNGFYAFLNLGVSLIASFGNGFYKIIATICVYFYFIGGEIFNTIATLIKKSVNLIFYLFVFTSIITAFYFSYKVSIPILDYLRANSLSNSYLPLLWIMLFTVSISICLITINYFSTIKYSFIKHKLKRDEETYNEKLTQVMQTLPILVFSFLVIGILLFSLSKIDLLKFSHFKSYGIVSGFLTAIVLVGFFIYLIDYFKSKKPTATATTSTDKTSEQKVDSINVESEIDLDKNDHLAPQEIWKQTTPLKDLGHKQKKKYFWTSLFGTKKSE